MSDRVCLNIPIPVGDFIAWVVIPAEMTREAWDAMLAVLAAYEPAVVVEPERASDRTLVGAQPEDSAAGGAGEETT